MKEIEPIKYLHVLSPDVDTAYWFIRMMEESADYYDHSFLIAANEKSVLNRYTKLFEFPDLLYLVGGTQGSDAKRRYDLLKNLFDRSEKIIWHGITFDTIDIVRALKNKKHLAKSTWICQPTDFEETEDLGKGYEKKKRAIMKGFATIALSDEQLRNRLAEYEIDASDCIETPYLINPEFFESFLDSIAKKEEEKREREELEDMLVSDEEFAALDASEEAEFKDIEVEAKTEPLTIQLGFAPKLNKEDLSSLRKLKDISKEDVRLIVPEDIWLNGVKVVHSSINKAVKAWFNAVFNKKITFSKKSFGINTFFDYLNSVDAILLIDNPIFKPVYYYLAVMLGKTFILPRNCPYEKQLEELGAKVLKVDSLNNDAINSIIQERESITVNTESVAPFFDLEKVLDKWQPLF